MMLRARFPVHERVKAGVPYKTMLQEVGIIGASIVTAAIFPAIMLTCYIILILYFRSKGGYKAEELAVQRE
jgi:hypothetical protein